MVYYSGFVLLKGIVMKLSAPLLLLLGILFTVAPLAAKGTQPQFNTIVVRHFTNANGMNKSQEFINQFSDSLRSYLEKVKIANQVVSDGVSVNGDAAADSLSIEGRFLGNDKEIYMVTVGKLNVETNIYRICDHALVKTLTAKVLIPPSLFKNDQDMAAETGSQIARQIQQALKNTSLSSIPPAPPSAAPAPSSGIAQSNPEAVASIQFSSDPGGAEITVDGNYVGNTPSLIKLKPGTHSVKITKNGYAPWVRSINTEGGESRNIAADLEKTSQ
jgi:hypothetical protein